MDLKNRNPVDRAHRKRVALVLANPSTNTIAGWPCGFWWSEVSHPYYLLTERGFGIEFFSPDGGACEPDAMSDPRHPNSFSSADLITMGFLNTPELMKLVQNTAPVAEIELDRFNALLVAGGQAPMFSFADATELQRTFVEFFEAAERVRHGDGRGRGQRPRGLTSERAGEDRIVVTIVPGVGSLPW
ncbi:MAG: hypothetical protein JWQ60_4362 [Pseudonocardia sp.]|nr:hypothetical protein [Pseudonocardia sp.]